MWSHWTRPVTIITKDTTPFLGFDHLFAGWTLKEGHAHILVERDFGFGLA